ncbi:glycosyl hydrolase family 28-related protein [Streptacidiphilus sp. EB129]|uniref:glycosyl hydrolase family 28-related protein n=1 Tax=Streptacidiphilus sp. EB129 TaxID=3156262 RepID=UPI003512B260
MDSNRTVGRRDALRLAALSGGVGLVAASATATPASAATQRAQTMFDVTAYGAVGDGRTDDTTAIQNALNAAATVKGAVVTFPPAPGGCYRTSGVTVPGGIGRLQGWSDLYDANGPAAATLTGSVLAPFSAATTTLLTVGSSGNGAVVDANPHGLTVDGLGFLGTTPTGTAAPALWGASVVDTSDVTFQNCRDVFCGAPGFKGYPTGGLGTGGFVRFLSSGTANVFSVNGRVLFCCSYGAGSFVVADGLSTAYPGGGSTDGRIIGCQVNGHSHGVQLGPTLAGAGGWGIMECHFSSAEGSSHVNYGLAGNPWTLRIEGCYFDLCAEVPIACHGHGLQVIGNYFRALGNATAVYFGSALATFGRDPAAVMTGNALDLNGATGVTCFAQFDGFTAAEFAAHGGGQYSGNLVHNHGAAMPKSWIGQFVGSNATRIAASSTASLDLAPGPVLPV